MMPPARASRQHSEARRFGEGIRTDSSVLVGSASPARAASQPPRGGGAASGGGRRERSGRRQRERARRAAEAAASQAALAARAVSSAATREGPNEAVSHRRRSRCRQRPREGSALAARRASRLRLPQPTRVARRHAWGSSADGRRTCGRAAQETRGEGREQQRLRAESWQSTSETWDVWGCVVSSRPTCPLGEPRRGAGSRDGWCCTPPSQRVEKALLSPPRWWSSASCTR